MRLALLLVPLIGCASHDWREAVRADTSAAYLAYAARNPGSIKEPAARRRAEDRMWAEANTANTSTGYAAYLSAFPGGHHTAEAQARAQELGFAEAKAEGTISALSAYAIRWPASPHAEAARTQAEDLIYEQAILEGTEASWARYLVQYPNGRYAAEATTERDQLVWTETVPQKTRQAYQRYLKEFPQGVHAEEARAWIAASYVGKVQPLVALVSTFQPSARSSVLGRVHQAFDAGFVPDLRAARFEVLPTRTVDATNGMPHPQELLGTEPDTGILILEYHEKPGREFDPSGTATDIQAVLRLYVPNSAEPVWVRTVDATTPDTVRGTELTALNQAAIEDLVNRLHDLKPDIASQRRAEAK
jgi:hypothetical protein